jgi:hypothetical protein
VVVEHVEVQTPTSRKESPVGIYGFNLHNLHTRNPGNRVRSGGMNRHERLSRAELGERFRQTAAFRDYAARPKVSFEDSIDEVAVRAEVAKRNQLRAEAKLPLVRFENEVGRLRAIFESDRSAEFNSLTYAMIKMRCMGS